jgi:hypothetical protein
VPEVVVNDVPVGTCEAATVAPVRPWPFSLLTVPEMLLVVTCEKTVNTDKQDTKTSVTIFIIEKSIWRWVNRKTCHNLCTYAAQQKLILFCTMTYLLLWIAIFLGV